MKKTLILLLAVGLFVACNNNKDKGMNGNKNTTQGDDYRNGNGNTGDNNNGNNNNNTNNTNSNNGSWSSADVSSFNAQCLTAVKNDRELARTFCPCLLEKFQNKYSSLAEMDKNSTEAEGTKAATQCKEELGIGDNNNGNTNVNGNDNGGAGWTREQEGQWINACETQELVEKMGQKNADTYCTCMMDKLKQQFSSFDEANTKGTYDLGVRIGKVCLREMGIATNQ